MSNPATSTSPLAFPLGVRCAKCQRFILRGARAKRGYSGRWRHEACERVPQPSAAEFDELAEVLMRRQPWPKLLTLQARLSEVDEQLDEVAPSARVPRQATAADAADAAEAEEAEEADTTEPAAPTREDELRERSEEIREAIAAERLWKARRLAAEWSDGH